MTDTLIHHRVAAARLGQNPTLICHMPSGHLVLCDHQTPRGWCILLPDPVVPDLNALDEPARLAFLSDMAAAGDALLRVTGAHRINYSILGNTDPALHAHIQPRYPDEPAHLRRLGISDPAQLQSADPYALFEKLCRLTGQRHDPCTLDVFLSAVRYMQGAPAKPWWAYTAERKATLTRATPKRPS